MKFSHIGYYIKALEYPQETCYVLCKRFLCMNDSGNQSTKIIKYLKNKNELRC
jgi:hypothetical protein